MKQKTKRTLLMLMSVMTIFAHAATIVTVNGLRYSLSGVYASVYGIAEGNTSESIIIPATITYEGLEYSVNNISSSAFDSWYGNNRYVKEIILPSTIKTIGQEAFNNPNITKVTLQEGITTIGSNAFSASKITELIIPSTVTSFGSDVFNNCDQLRTLIYLCVKAPSNWTATSQTYVPSKSVYRSPSYSINYSSIIQMITFSKTIFTYTGTAPTPTWTNNMEGYSVNMEIPALKSEVGTWDTWEKEEVIPATFSKGEEKFTAYIPYYYIISPAPLKAKVNNASRTYGEANPNFTITYSGFVNGEDESVLSSKPVATTSANEKSEVGTYPITISGGESQNYAIEYEQGELTVNKASLGIQVLDARKVYGTENPTLTLGYSGLKNDETVPAWTTSPKFTTTATKASGAGTYDVAVTCEPKNYEIISNTSGKLIITKAPLNITANNATMDYCGTMPTYSYTYSGFVNGDTEDALSTKPSIVTEATATSNAGNYSITPEGAQSNNYDFTYTAGTLTIKQRPLSVKANSLSRVYGENNPKFTIEYTGFVNDETEDVLDAIPTISTTATVQSKAGSYDIRVSSGQAKNYTFIYQNGQLTITPRPLKAYVDNYERPYGENNPTFEILYEGLIGNDTGYSLSTQPMARCSATKTSNVGTYTIEVTGGYSPNYSLTYGSGLLTVVKAEQCFTWNQDLTNLKVGDHVELLANASSKLPITYTIDSYDFAEIYKAGSKTYMECKAAGSFHIKAVQEGNDNYYSTSRINKDVTIAYEDEYNPTLYIKQTDNGMIGTKVNKGSKHTFKIYAETGWKVHSITFNNADVTNELDADDSFTTPAINENATLIVVYEQECSAVNNIQNSNVKVLATSYGVKVIGVSADEEISVYTIDGALQQSVRADNSVVEIPLQKNCVYIIKVGAKAIKLRL